MIKYTSVEKVKVLSEESHRRIAKGLAKIARRNIEDLGELDKERILQEIDDDELDQ